jgi:soluble lytic murein transglycosylase
MRRTRLLALTLLVAATPAIAQNGPHAYDPLAEAAAALEQGRHWHATLILRGLDSEARAAPEVMLLAGRADAGRGAWAAVLRRLESATWLDSIASGAGRALLARARLETGQFAAALRDFRIFLRYAIEPEPRALAEIGQARALEALGHRAEAAAAFARASDIEPVLESWSALRAAESLATTGDTAAVADFLERATDTPIQRRAAAAAAAWQSAGADRAAAARLLAAAGSEAPGAAAAELRARAARIFLGAGDTAAAVRALRPAVRSHPANAAEAAEILATLPGLRPDDRLNLATAFERSGRPARAADQLRAYIEAASPAPREKQQLQLEIAQLLYDAGSDYAALDECRRLLAQPSELPVRAQAELVAARATYRRGWRSEGRARLREVADRYPGSAPALRALSLLADLYEGAADLARARAVYEELVDRYAGTVPAREARYRLGLLAFAEGDLAAARQHLDRLRRAGRFDQLQIQATYWAARVRSVEEGPRSADALSLFREVQRRDPFGYYGLLAAERAGIDPWAELQPGPRPAALDPERAGALDLLDLLRRAGLDSEADAVLSSLTAAPPHEPERLLSLSAALAARGFGLDATQLAWSAHARLGGRWSATVLRAIYPLTYPEIVAAEAATRDLDPYLLASIARQESAFSPGAISRAGARGLLQIMPETGRWWARRLGVEPYSDDLLFHPEVNAHLGAAYFADLQRRYGDPLLALIAYNAGPTRARRWRERPEYRLDPELFAETVPLTETRNYLRGVESHRRIYARLYPQPPGRIPDGSRATRTQPEDP